MRRALHETHRADGACPLMPLSTTAFSCATSTPAPSSSSRPKVCARRQKTGYAGSSEATESCARSSPVTRPRSRSAGPRRRGSRGCSSSSTRGRACPLNRPDLVDFRGGETAGDDKSEDDPSDTARDAYLWPHISQADLSGPRNFLLMINARGRNHPRVFADADWESTKLARGSWNVKPVVLNGYTMMLNGSPARGIFIRHPQAPLFPGADLAHLSGRSVGHPASFAALEEQVRPHATH